MKRPKDWDRLQKYCVGPKPFEAHCMSFLALRLKLVPLQMPFYDVLIIIGGVVRLLFIYIPF